MPTPEDYIAGAVVANLIAWIVSLSFIAVSYSLLVLSYAVGAVLAGFLVARKAGGEAFWKVGLKSGLGAFVLHMFLVTAVEIVMSVIIWPLEAHVVLLAVFLLSGVSGAFLFSFPGRGRLARKPLG